MKRTGVVKWFDDAKGYGFIVNDESRDVFVHYRCIMSDAERKTLHEGDVVEYHELKGAKGLQAGEVTVLEHAVDQRQHA